MFVKFFIKIILFRTKKNKRTKNLNRIELTVNLTIHLKIESKSCIYIYLPKEKTQAITAKIKKKHPKLSGARFR